MKTIWDILQIDPTTDSKAIRGAYARLLKETSPEVNPEGFQELRAAYESALKSAPISNSTPFQSQKKQPPIPKAPHLVEVPSEPEVIFSIPKAPPINIPPQPPAKSETELQVDQMIRELQRIRDPFSKASQLRKWKEEGIFSHLGISQLFQQELLDLFAPKVKKSLFLTGYTLFDWDLLRQKPSHPLAQKLERIIQKGDFFDSLSLLEKVKDCPFLYAAVAEDIPLAKQLLRENPSILYQTDANGNSAIHLACFVHSTQFVKFLIAENVDLETKGVGGQTALSIAVSRENLELVQLLCEAGANLNHLDDDKQSPIFFATFLANDDLVRYLVDQPDLERDPEALYIAVVKQKFEFVQLLVEYGWDVSPKNLRQGPPCLITAARLNNLNIVNYLLAKGADPDQTDQVGNTALTMAAERGFSQIVKRLLDYTTDQNAILLAAHGAIKYSHFEIVQLLLTASQNSPHFTHIKYEMYRYGFTSYYDDVILYIHNPDDPPLIQAVYRGDLKEVKRLLKEGADLNQLSQQGLAPLHVAIQLHHQAIFDTLIQSHADINLVAKTSYLAPLFIAVKVQNRHAYRKLMELGALDLPTGSHHTALFAAVYNNDIKAVQELLERGSNPYQYASNLYRTLVYAAARYRHIEMLKFLISYGLHPDDIGGDPGELYLLRYQEQPEVPGTALSVAVNNCDQEMIEILLEAGADPNRKSFGVPPLHRTMSNSYFPPSETTDYYEIIENSHAIIDLLLERGADINLKSDDGYTFLIKAIRSGPIETVIHLIESGADLYLRDNQGNLPIAHAKACGFIKPYLEQAMHLPVRK